MGKSIGRKTVGALILAGVIGLSALLGRAAAGDKKINVQGRLTDAASVPVAGAQIVTFRLYLSSGDPIASRVWEDSFGVVFDSGTFNMTLGQSASLDGLVFNKPYYLGIQIAGDAQEMSPRQLLGASAYAMGSLGDFHAGGSLRVGGNAGIGTSAPQAALHVVSGDDAAVFQSSAAAGSPAVRIKNGTRSWAMKVSGNSGSGFSLTDETAGLSRLAVSSSGLVGIGTDNPQVPLDVRTSAGVALALNNNTALGFRKANGSSAMMQLYGGTDDTIHSANHISLDGGGALILTNNAGSISFKNTAGNIGMQIYGGSDNMIHTSESLYVGGTLYASGGKSFLIPHPLAPRNKMLVHGAVEGPEFAVYYRGQSQLSGGRVSVALPDYFEALTRPEDRTVQLTCVGDYSPLFVSSAPANGQLEVRTTAQGNPSQAFYWEVKAVRADVARLKTVKRRKDLPLLNAASPDSSSASMDEKE